MAFDPMQLSAVAYANGWTMWHYRTEDKRGDIVYDLWTMKNLNYFGDGLAASMLRPGDLIHINAHSEGDVDCFSVWVRSNEDGFVVVEEV